MLVLVKRMSGMVSQSPKNTPFGLEPNIAAGLAYLFPLVGGVILLLGGGTDRFVRWAIAQSITLWGVYVAFFLALNVLTTLLFAVHLGLLVPILLLAGLLVGIASLVAWFWTWISAFQGKDVRLPFIADLAQRLFASSLSA